MKGPRMDGPGAAPEGSSDEWRALLDRLYALSRNGMVLGLERIQRVMEALGRPERAFPTIHIAGSNGKGSTSAFTASILSTRGQRIGLFTSPHLVSLTERVQIVERCRPREIEQEEMASAIAAVERTSPGFEGLTFFEVITAAGLIALAEHRVDAAVIEAGLGARLDATRLVDAQVSVLTDLSLEHTQILGSTLEQIAYEKSAVVRKGRPLVCADSSPGAMAVVDRAAEEAGSPVYRIDRDLFARREADGSLTLDLGDRVLRDVQLALRGPHQHRNALLAAKAASLLDPSLTDGELRAGLAGAAWPGRMEVIGRGDAPPVLLDGAQNPAAARALANALIAERASFPGPLHFVFGALSDKDARSMIAAIAPLASTLVLTRPSSPRARAPEELLEMSPEGARVIDSPWDAFAAAEDAARREGGWVVVCGSLFLVGDLRARLSRG